MSTHRVVRGVFYTFESPTYSISGTYGGLFDGNSFDAVIDDNFVEAVDFTSGTSFADAMQANNLNTFDTYDTYDSLIFFTSKSINTDPNFITEYFLAGYMLFEKDFFNGSITTLPSSKSLLKKTVFSLLLS